MSEKKTSTEVGYMVYDKYYTIHDCRSQPNRLFLFGDNAERKGTLGQAQIRGLSNAFGIVTKIKPRNESTAFYADKDYARFKRACDADFLRLSQREKDFQWVVFPIDGLGTGLAQLHTKAPQCFAYLCTKILQHTGLIMTDRGFR